MLQLIEKSTKIKVIVIYQGSQRARNTQEMSED